MTDDMIEHKEILKEEDIDNFFIDVEAPMISDNGEEASFYCPMYDSFYEWLFGPIKWGAFSDHDQTLETYLLYNVVNGDMVLEVHYTDYEGGNSDNGRLGNRIVMFDNNAYRKMRARISKGVKKILWKKIGSDKMTADRTATKRYRIVIDVYTRPAEIKGFREELDDLVDRCFECSGFDVFGVRNNGSALPLDYGDEDFKEDEK